MLQRTTLKQVRLKSGSWDGADIGRGVGQAVPNADRGGDGGGPPLFLHASIGTQASEVGAVLSV